MIHSTLLLLRYVMSFVSMMAHAILPVKFLQGFHRW